MFRKTALFVALTFATLAAALMGSPVNAGPIVYNPIPFESIGQQFTDVYAAVNGQTQSATTVACTGTTTATCQGLRPIVSVTGLSTAAGAVSATMTVTDASVSSTSQIVCQVNGYGGTGVPNVVNVVPGSSSFTFAIQNNAASAVLSATVPASCMVYN